MRPDLAYWLALARTPHLGAVRLTLLANTFPSMREAFYASASELVAAGIPQRIAEQLASTRARIHPEQELARVTQENIHVITIKDASYPPALRTIYDPPALLFVRGTLPPSTIPHLAIVGTRNPTRYTTHVLSEIVAPVLHSGVVIVSGLAIGVDTIAHETALAQKQPTIAVVGSGVNDRVLYPTRHVSVAHRIIEQGGAVISEFPLDTTAFKSHFPIRNRIIAGLSKAVLVVEAHIKSGSLITAKAALEHGRDVLAIPGPIHAPLSEGPNMLIRTGAGLISSSQDLCDALGTIRVTQPSTTAPDDPTQAQIWHAAHMPIHTNDLIRKLAMSAATINSVLTQMELNGIMRHLGGNQYIRA